VGINWWIKVEHQFLLFQWPSLANSQMRRLLYTAILASILSSSASFAEPQVNIAGGKATVTWSSKADTQYRVYGTDDLSVPRANWDQVGTWFAGNGSQLSVDEALGSHRFFVVEEGELNQFEIDVEEMGYSTIGRTWTYNIIDSRENDVPYDATYEIVGMTEYPNTILVTPQEVFEMRGTSPNHPNGGNWEAVTYYVNDFSSGLYVAGGVNGSSTNGGDFNEGPYRITSPAKWPLLFNSFTLGEVIEADYTHDFYGAVDNEITHAITTYTLPGETEPRTAIQVTSEFTANVSGSTVTSTTVDTFVEGVGLVAKQLDVVSRVGPPFGPSPVSVTATLTGYTVP
jgi:hypothetical protein